MNDHEDLVTVSYAESWLVRPCEVILQYCKWFYVFFLPVMYGQHSTTDFILMTITIRPQERTRPISIRWCIPMIGLTPLTIKVTLRGTLFREFRFYKNHFQEPFPHTGKWNQPPTLQLITRSSRFRRRSSSLTRLLKS